MVRDADPGQSELSRIDRNPACVAKELAALPYPNNRGVDTAQDGVNAVEALDPVFRLGLFGHVLKRIEAAHPAVRVGRPLNRLENLPHLNPHAIRTPQPVFELPACPLDARLDGCRTENWTIFRMHDFQPFACASGHFREIGSDQRRQRFGPALERAVRPRDHMSKLGHKLRPAQPGLARLELAKQADVLVEATEQRTESSDKQFVVGAELRCAKLVAQSDPPVVVRGRNDRCDEHRVHRELQRGQPDSGGLSSGIPDSQRLALR